MTSRELAAEVPTALNAEQARWAPHLLFLKQVERLDEAMAAGRDPLPAFLAWKSALEPWCRDDPHYQKETAALHTHFKQRFREVPTMPAFQYVYEWRPLLFGVMRRAGMFNPNGPGHAPATTADRLRQSHAPEASR